MTNWLIRFGLGGVQPFIAESRKLRDFAAASRIFSEICADVTTDTGVLPVLPVIAFGGQSLPSRPHQITLSVSCSKERVSEIGRQMVTRAREVWWEKARKVLDGKAGVRIIAEVPTQDHQLETTLEPYWVAVELKNDSGDPYADAYARLEQAYTARRWTRTFAPLTSAPQGQRWSCSQCGARSAVTDKPKESTFPLYSAGERLCAVCLTKRGWPLRRRGFESTHAVARARVDYDPALTKDRARFCDRLWLDVDAADIEDVRDAAKTLRVSCAELTNHLERVERRCSPYYALIAFDGDQMGRWFSSPERWSSLRDGQQHLGRALVRFAGSLESVVNRLNASLVYAGGDDGFIVAPLDSVLSLLRHLHGLWLASIEELQHLRDAPPTISLHVSVVHAKSPLQPALAAMRRDLSRTKERADRNAFSIRVDVRSGASTVMAAKWNELPNLLRAVALTSNWRLPDQGALNVHGGDEARTQLAFARIIERREEHRLPTRLLHAVLDAIPPFFQSKGNVYFPDELRNECLRLAARSGPRRTDGSGATGRAVPPVDRRRQEAADRRARHASRRREQLFDWLMKRANGVGGQSLQRIPGLEAMESAITVVAFLSRELSWKPLTVGTAGAAMPAKAAAGVG